MISLRVLMLAGAMVFCVAGCGPTRTGTGDGPDSPTPVKGPAGGKRVPVKVTKAPKGVRRRDIRPIELEVIDISGDGKFIQLDGGLNQRVAVGDTFQLIHRIEELPPSRYTSYQTKGLLIGRAEVIDVQENTCRCKVIHKNTVNPVRLGNVAIAHAY